MSPPRGNGSSPPRPAPVRRRGFVASLVLVGLGVFPGPAHAGPELLIRAKVNGRESGVYEKVIVTHARASLVDAPAANARGKPVEPFDIFFRLKTDSGEAEQGGFVRVGTSRGEPRGWIRREQVTPWSTRFVLDPIREGDRQFVATTADGVPIRAINEAPVPDNARRFALVTGSPEADPGGESQYPIVVYTGPINNKDARGRDDITDLKLEVIFVLESTDFMLGKFGDVVLLDLIKDLLRDLVQSIRSDPELAGAVRLGVVEYQDSTQNAQFVSRLTCPLTDDPSRIIASLDSFAPVALKDDFPDDAIAGLVTAIQDNAGWSGNSSKHIILIGQAACQLYAKGRGPNDFGFDTNSLTHQYERTVEGNYRVRLGWNSTGVSLEQLIALAHPEGTSQGNKFRAAKTFHTVLTGRDVEKALPPEIDIKQLRDVVEQLLRLDDQQLNATIAKIAEDAKLNNDQANQLFSALIGFHLNEKFRPLARDQHRMLAQNGGEATGMQLEVEPTPEEVRRAVETIKQKLSDAYKALKAVRDGDGAAGRAGASEIAQQIYRMDESAREKYKDTPGIACVAPLRDPEGREVAIRKVLVSREELERLRSTLDSIQEKFQARVAREQRQDVTRILDDLKQIVASTVTGQTLTAESNLRDLITDLPLRTSALDVTPQQIAAMSSETFQQWLQKLDRAMKRSTDILERTERGAWMEISAEARDEQFTFLPLNQLP